MGFLVLGNGQEAWKWSLKGGTYKDKDTKHIKAQRMNTQTFKGPRVGPDPII